MKTVKESVTDNVQIWATPQSQSYMDENPNALPFKYRLSTSRVWESGAVQVYDQEITMEVPEGLDLLQAAVKTMKASIAETRATAEKEIGRIQERIDSLLMLTHQTVEPAKTGDAFNDELSVA